MRCVEYYDKCEREGCDWCETERTAIKMIEDYIKFYKELETYGVPRAVTIVTMSENAAQPVIRIQDKDIRERAIIKCSERLNPNSKGGRGNTKELTEKVVKKIIEDIEIELRNEEMKKEIAELKAEEERTGIHKITQEEADALLGITDEPEKDPEPIINKQGNPVYSEEEVEKIKAGTPKSITVNTIMQFEIDLYFEVMKKIGCDEDIPKHKKRIKIMIENQTLLIVG